MANAFKREKSQKLISLNTLFLLLSISFLIFLLFIFSNLTNPTKNSTFFNKDSTFNFKIQPLNCQKTPQSYPIIASIVEGLKHPFIYSLSDLGNLPEKPHKNIQRIMKKKPFKRPDISVTIQEVMGRFKSEGKDGVFIDVGANVGMASFAAAVMGFRVYAFEPVFENLQRICDGVWFNRVWDFVSVFDVAVSDNFGSVTFHKLVGRLDNSAISATGAKLAFKSNEEVAVEVKTIPLDEIIPESESVLMIKIDVQGWEYHVLKGAKKLLSRKGAKAPYLIYEEDERLLQASNSTVKEIRDFLASVGYDNCTKHGGDAHCTKKG